MIIGYARVSTHEQHLDLQIQALEKFDVQVMYQEKVSSVKEKRPEFEKCISYLRQGDTLVVWKLDRLGRNLKSLLEIVENLQQKQINLVSLHEHIDTSTTTGKLMFQIFSALAEYERGIIIERTKAGINAARVRGKSLGRPKGMSPEMQKKAELAKILYQDKQKSVKDICTILAIPKATFYYLLEKQGVKREKWIKKEE